MSLTMALACHAMFPWPHSFQWVPNITLHCLYIIPMFQSLQWVLVTDAISDFNIFSRSTMDKHSICPINLSHQMLSKQCESFFPSRRGQMFRVTLACFAVIWQEYFRARASSRRLFWWRQWRNINCFRGMNVQFRSTGREREGLYDYDNLFAKIECINIFWRRYRRNWWTLSINKRKRSDFEKILQIIILRHQTWAIESHVGRSKAFSEAITSSRNRRRIVSFKWALDSWEEMIICGWIRIREGRA